MNLVYFFAIALLNFISICSYSQEADRLNTSLKDSLKTQISTIKKDAVTNEFLLWKLKAIGIKSGEELIIKGGSKELETCWKMLSEKLTAKFPEEKIAIEMTFSFTNILLTDTIEPSKIKKFPKKHFEILSDCEVFNYVIPEWSSPFDNNTVITAEIDMKHSAPQGKGCLKLEGKDENNDGYICSLTKHFKTVYTSNSSVMTSLSTKASETWIFFYAFGNGNSSDAVQLLIAEAAPDGLMDNKATMGFYSYEVPLDFFGWKQIGIKYSELQPTVPFFVNDKRQTFGKQGDQILDPKELMGIQFTLVTKIPGSKASVYLDQLMILFNK